MNQSVLQISSQDVEGKRSDKTDFAERLGAMNRRWHILQGRVTEKVSHACEKTSYNFNQCTSFASSFKLVCSVIHRFRF